MIKLQRLGHVLIAVRDLERSKAFYTRILGFEVLEQDPDHGGLFLSLPGLGNTLDLFQSKQPDAGGTPKAGLGNVVSLGVRHTAFAVATEDDLKEAFRSLKSAGVEILDARDHGNQKSVYFYDPDNNLLEIVWERPDTREIFARGRGDHDESITFDQ